MLAFHRCKLPLIGQKQDNDYLHKMNTDVSLSTKQIQVIYVKGKCNLLQIALSAHRNSKLGIPLKFQIFSFNRIGEFTYVTEPKNILTYYSSYPLCIDISLSQFFRSKGFCRVLIDLNFLSCLF